MIVSPGDSNLMTVRRVCIVGLLALAGAQARAMWRGNPDETGPISVGTDLSTARATTPEGIERELAAGMPLLVLVFDPECPHSRRVATDWARWLGRSHERPFEVLAVSPGPAGAAASYAEASAWGVSVATTGGAVVRRTPWVFALDRSGRVVADGHGVRLSDVAATLAEHVIRANY